MQQTNQVYAAFRKCENWYAAGGENIRQVSERAEELWFQMDDLVFALQAAEEKRDIRETASCLQSLLRCAHAIEAEVRFVRLWKQE